MPGVKLPEIPKHQSQMPLSVGRTKVDMPDATRAMAKQSKGVENLADSLVQFEDKLEADAADTEATKRASEYEVSFRSRLYGDGKTPGVKFQEGDPTPVYQQFDADMDEEYKRLTDVSDLSPRAAKLVNQRVTDRAQQLQMTRLSEYGAQNAKYEHQVYKADNDLVKQAFPEASVHIVPDKPESFAVYDDRNGDLRNNHIRKGLASGGVQRDDNGEMLYFDRATGEKFRVSLGPVAQKELLDDLSEANYNTMNVLLKAGEIDKANAIKDRYGNVLNAQHKAALADDFQRATVDNKATLLSMYPNKEKEILKNTSEAEAIKIKDQARALRNNREAEIEQSKNRIDKRNSEDLIAMIHERQKAGFPYNSLEGAMQDNQFAIRMDKLNSVEAKRAIETMITQPPKSTPEALDRVQALIYGDDPNKDVRKMSNFEINKELSGLDKPDRTAAEAVIFKMKNETEEESRVKFNSASVYLKNEYMRLNNLGEYDFRGNADHMTAFNEWRYEMAPILEKSGPLNPAEVQKIVRGFAVSKFENKEYVAPEPNKFKGRINDADKQIAMNKPFYEVSPVEEPKRYTQSVSAPAPKAAYVPRTRPEWNRAYTREFGVPPNPQQLDAYIKRNGG